MDVAAAVLIEKIAQGKGAGIIVRQLPAAASVIGRNCLVAREKHDAKSLVARNRPVLRGNHRFDHNLALPVCSQTFAVVLRGLDMDAAPALFVK